MILCEINTPCHKDLILISSTWLHSAGSQVSSESELIGQLVTACVSEQWNSADKLWLMSQLVTASVTPMIKSKSLITVSFSKLRFSYISLEYSFVRQFLFWRLPVDSTRLCDVTKFGYCITAVWTIFGVNQ